MIISINDSCRIKADRYQFTIQILKKDTWYSNGHYGRLDTCLAALLAGPHLRDPDVETISELKTHLSSILIDVLKACKPLQDRHGQMKRPSRSVYRD